MERSINRIRTRVVTGFLFLVFTCGTAWAQNTAQVSGAVRDQTGAVLPGVEVTATQTATGQARSTLTGETGSYILPNLPIGPYRLEASLPGFRTFVQTGIVLQVGANPVVNAVLEVGQVSDQIEVQADAALVETRNTTVGQVIDNQRVLELPLNARQVTELIVLSGAAIGGGNQATNRNYPTQSISVGGGMNNGLTYLLDGGTHNDPFNNLNFPLPFPDALQEFKVETSAAPAQYGEHSAGAVNLVTKSGTNEFHGNLFEFVRNDVFNARPAFAVAKDGLKRNQFGGTLGGPVVRNKMFFFGGYQGTIERAKPREARAYVATAQMLAGDFTTIASTQCRARALTLRSPFVNNRIDPARFSRPALNMLKLLPTTTDPCGEVRYGRVTNNDEHVVASKIDYQWSDSHSLFGRYQLHDLFTPTDYDGSNILSSSQAHYARRVNSFVLGDTYLLGTGLVNSFHGTLNRVSSVKYMEGTGFPSITLESLGVRGTYDDPGVADVPSMSVDGGFTLHSDPGMPGYTNSTVFQFVDDLSWVRGAHQIGFGANFIHRKMNVKATSAARPGFSFGTDYTGLGFGDFLLGLPSDYAQGMANAFYWRQNYWGFYLQDTWKATSKVTVSAGIRWEPFRAPYDKRERVLYFKQEWFDQGIRSKIYPNAPAGLLFRGDSGVPEGIGIGPNHTLRFAPRLGLAWDPQGDGRMTIRSAYGIFTDYPHFYQYGGYRDQPPWGYEVTIENPTGGFEDPWRGVPGGNPFPATLNPNIPFPVAGTYVTIPLDFRMPYVHQWNLSIQRQIGTDWLLAGNYIGNSVIHFLTTSEGNPAVYIPGSSCVIHGQTFTPCSSTSNTTQRRQLYLKNGQQGQAYGNIVVGDDGGTRSYNALWLQAQRRSANGLTVQTNYTWAHCIDDDGDTTQYQNNGQHRKERRADNRGDCDQDTRHNFNLSTVYETPQFSNRTLRLLAGGWRISGIVRLLSGQYLTIASGRDNALTGDSDRRPNQVLANPYTPEKTLAQYLNPAAFAQPDNGTYGNLGRNNIQGPGSIRIDMGLTRRFQLRESHSLEFRAEAFNMPNHLNPSNPNVTFTNANFGRILGSGDPRIMQVALKYVF